jgi:hypothetical protein
MYSFLMKYHVWIWITVLLLISTLFYRYITVSRPIQYKRKEFYLDSSSINNIIKHSN